MCPLGCVSDLGGGDGLERIDAGADGGEQRLIVPGAAIAVAERGCYT
jgi:hypothetical protein